MDIENAIWDAIPEQVKEAALHKANEAWTRVRWWKAESDFLSRIAEQISTFKLLGNPRDIDLTDIFTQVFALPTPAAKRRFTAEQIEKATLETIEQRNTAERVDAGKFIAENNRTYILGKPGAGKTTLLKSVALQCTRRALPFTPLFLPLKDIPSTSGSLLSSLEHLFDVCGFARPTLIIDWLLSSGQAILLLDGLDEVREQTGDRHRIIAEIGDFTKKYPNLRIVLTCRTAAEEYTFDTFNYCEISDFDATQQVNFIKRWYGREINTLGRFFKNWAAPQNQGLRDLAKTPLLLALLCLVFEETLEFPDRKVDLYKEAMDAYLRRWDSSRRIQRDPMYGALSLSRREQLLGAIATETFERGKYLFSATDVSEVIIGFFQRLPKFHGKIDVEEVLRTIEEQHGLVVKQSVHLYSFSHLTIHEYFCAKTIVERAATDGYGSLLTFGRLTDDRWREVTCLTASLLPAADTFIRHMLEICRQSLEENKPIVSLLRSVLQGERAAILNYTSPNFDTVQLPPDTIIQEGLVVLDRAAFLLDRSTIGRERELYSGLVRQFSNFVHWTSAFHWDINDLRLVANVLRLLALVITILDLAAMKERNDFRALLPYIGLGYVTVET